MFVLLFRESLIKELLRALSNIFHTYLFQVNWPSKSLFTKNYKVTFVLRFFQPCWQSSRNHVSSWYSFKTCKSFRKKIPAIILCTECTGLLCLPPNTWSCKTSCIYNIFLGEKVTKSLRLPLEYLGSELQVRPWSLLSDVKAFRLGCWCFCSSFSLSNLT